MYFSQLLCPTLKENPAEAEVASHRLMLRSGMIRQLAAGIYNLLPVGLRSLRKVEQIVREEMNRSGAQEVSLPAVHPAELWRESGRWDQIGKELLRFKDRNERDFCFGPTHEEVVTDIVRREVRSYRDLPLNLYQIQVKFRDEVRPRFGLMRGREFVMKDAYSFDVDDAASEDNYRRMYDTYGRIFERCGLDFRAVEADSGNIGGSMSQEFMVLAPTGEDELISCMKCDYAANVEKAQSQIRGGETSPLPKRLEKKQTPGKTSVSDVAAFLKVAESQLVKTLIYKTEKEFVAALIPGDREMNETRLKSHLGAVYLALASAEEIRSLTKAPVGFAGPVGLEVNPGGITRLIVDSLIEEGTAYVVGGNQKDLHLLGAVAGQDFPVTDRADIHRASSGDLCVRCGAELRSDRGIEVGHVFKLGTKYSEAMGAHFTAKDGTLRPAVMGCYGIGIGRTLAAAIEQHHDEAGIIFPPPLAPFDVVVLAMTWKDERVRKECERIKDLLMEEGYDVLVDDREESAGKRFKDVDLLGIPIRIVVGEKGLSKGKLEVKARWVPTAEFIDPANLVGWVRDTRESFKQRRKK